MLDTAVLHRRLLILISLLLACALGAPEARALDPAATFNQAQRLFDAGKQAQALPLFREAFAATGSPNARLYVARCLRDTGKLVQAYDEMRATLQDATQRASSESRYVPTRDSAAAELAVLEPRIAKLIVAPTSDYDGLAVSAGARLLSAEQLGVPVAMLPGTVTLKATADGMAPWSRQIDLAAGSTRTLTLTLAPATSGAGPAAGSQGAPEEPAQAEGIGPVRLAGVIVAGVGVLGLGAFVAAGVTADQRFGQLAEECGGVRCTDPAYADITDEGRTLQTVANVSAGIGGALALAGTLMIIFGGGATADDAGDPPPSVALVPLPGGGWLSVSGRF